MSYQCDCEQTGKTDSHKVQQGRGTMKATKTKDGQCVYCDRFAVYIPRQRVEPVPMVKFYNNIG